MGPWQTGREVVRSLAEKVGSLGGEFGAGRKDPGLNGRGTKDKRKKSVKNVLE